MTVRRDKAKKQRQPLLNKQLESDATKPAKEKNEVAIEFGKFLLDLAKLTFGGMFLTAIMDLSYNMERVMVVCGIIITLISSVGFIFIKIGNRK